MEILPGDLLKGIDNPSDLKKLKREQLAQLSNELRQYIIDVVSMYGGHLAASLGVVELTVALHYVFNTPYDQVVWDVGHQAYGHKILTGRRDNFITNRKLGGISGFPKRSESEYDTFGVGHSSTSISAALGMALASKYKGEYDRQHIAVIGDGALTAGLAFEGLNHAGISQSNLLIILNDNHMSIDPNVGALTKYLSGLNERKDSNKTDDGFAARKTNFFESLQLQYFGPVNGHDLTALIDMLTLLRNTDGPKLLHIKTIKGKGYVPAEQNQTQWHAPGLFDKISGQILKKKTDSPQPPKYQDVFGHTIIELAKQNDKIMGVTPAMPTGSSLKFMMDEMPDRAFDVGICEQHAVTLSAGMATQGLRVYCNIYSTFMQRAYDQVIHDVAIQDLPVIFCLDRAGIVGEDGPTHHGAFDIAYMRCIPNMIVSAPMNEHELRNLMYTAQLNSNSHPFAIRYPRGRGVLTDWRNPFEEIPVGKGRKLRDGQEIAILSLGHPGNFVTEAISKVLPNGINPAHYDMRFAKPLDEELLHRIFNTYSKIITIEDGTVKGGFGAAVSEFVEANNYKAQITIIGIPDKFIEHGAPEELYKEIGMDAEGITHAIQRVC
ncbi:MAG: 1-deoxy-D-xylulose-5-phosphate synthase [Chitinophagaceae bacterium]|nr:1-deoxy-D-xylulose-5-phosphate synthase [Chitinophagaceae bacterium]MCZ2397605.1 1-deoxy-D-xylulose-5-phosphate synthase [Chitinophagales bacterium]